MKAILAIAGAILLAGCIPDQQKQMAACEVKALQAYPNDTSSGFSPSERLAHFEQVCMRAEGYRLTCEYENLSDEWRCYEPIDDLDRWVFHIESWLERRRSSN